MPGQTLSSAPWGEVSSLLRFFLKRRNKAKRNELVRYVEKTSMIQVLLPSLDKTNVISCSVVLLMTLDLRRREGLSGLYVKVMDVIQSHLPSLEEVRCVLFFSLVKMKGV